MEINKKHIINNLTVLNWNADGLKRQRAIFLEFLARHNVDVACISETHLTNAETFKVPGYEVYRTDRNTPTASGGVAIIIKRKLAHYSLINLELENLETVAIKLVLENNALITLYAAYKQPNKRIQEGEITKMFNENDPTLVIGDLNSKLTDWGCRAKNQNGVRLNNIIINHGIQIAAPTEYTFHPRRPDHRPDILDVVLFKNFRKPIYQTVLNELESDHLPVVISFFNTPQQIPVVPRLIEGKIDWEVFHNELDKNIKSPGPIHTNDDIDKAVRQYIEVVKISIQPAVTSMNNKKRRYPSTPIEILNLIKLKNKTRREWQRTRRPYLKILTNQLTHKVRWELENYKYSMYNKYIEELQPRDATMWQATKRLIRQPNIIHPLTDNNITYVTDEEKASVLAAHYEHIFTPNNTNIANDHLQEVNTAVNDFISQNPREFTPTSPTEIKEIITKLPIKKSPGSDLITNSIIKQLTKKAVAFLATIFNACLRLGYFPNQWKHAIILPFHKSGKDKHRSDSYRPISLLPTLSKVLEKIIQTRLQIILEGQNIIPYHQFGFKKQHSTTHQLLRLTETIERGFENKGYTVICFIDLQNAFDRVWHDGLRYKMIKLGLPDYLIDIITSFITDRTFAVRVHATLSTKRKIEAGVPQGSVLGPTLFNLYAHDIAITNNFSLAMFADDTAVITQNEKLETAVNSLQNALNTICVWFDNWKVKINATKSQVKVFTLKQIKNLPSVRINQNIIEWNARDTAVKYLGVYLDTRLGWGIHTNKKLSECYSRLSLLYPLINRKSHLSIECTMLIYKSILRPIITYACPVWSNTSKTHLKKLQVLQNKISRIAVNAPWFVRNDQIHRELNLPTVEEHLKKQCTKFFDNINKCPSAVFYNLGQKNQHHRLKRRLPQDLL